ncbi:hypothetical protein M378DRAFT_168352 [Amanita muscaria Koide BX008]|uniref:Uncharacterized protein n=1 Tax=Amanita muscaria (strain Koide BX008) TaxID=946122 RepID=A0A0C2WV57_AMAMK|nr:hypothetical protein M378DRAFT_168352 [Amanita muscaria Koide BX008]
MSQDLSNRNNTLVSTREDSLSASQIRDVAHHDTINCPDVMVLEKIKLTPSHDS